VHLTVANAGSPVASVDIDPNGNVSLQCNGNLSATVGGNVSANVQGTVTGTVQGAVTLNASAGTTINGPLTVNGLFTFTEGMAGSGGTGSTATITGNVTVTSGEVTVDGIGVKAHHHDDPQGGETSSAKA
jgi:phage baseplate assembly protein gpV